MTKYVTDDLVKVTYDAVSGGPWPDETYTSQLPASVIDLLDAAVKFAAPRIVADVLDDLARDLEEHLDHSTAGMSEAIAQVRRRADEFRQQPR